MSSSLVKLVHDSSSSRVDGMKEHGVAGKALALVELLANRDYPVQMSEIVQATGIPKPTAHRLINFLFECGYVQRHPVLTGYIVGKNLSLLALEVLANRTGSSPQRVYLERLVKRCSLFFKSHVSASWEGFNASMSLPIEVQCTGTLLPASQWRPKGQDAST